MHVPHDEIDRQLNPVAVDAILYLHPCALARKGQLRFGFGCYYSSVDETFLRSERVELFKKNMASCDWRADQWTKADQVDSMLKLQLFPQYQTDNLDIEENEAAATQHDPDSAEKPVTTHVFLPKEEKYHGREQPLLTCITMDAVNNFISFPMIWVMSNNQ
ncbi:hypothetical protein EVAR_37528_1 [Eumeta japonica]|uniref:Uncharacterized protein n=1 Tax=Eumeta variegata TaxID=151549 RepID=A0A4C1XC20_EUMVA|nr:hypothetical protein EVAR_37528_1 [Eumeta japonica]